MGKLSLKVMVAGRSYPLTVNEGEEARVMKAAEDINKSIKMLQDSYAVKDMQDLLAMTALQLSTRSAASSPTKAEPDYSAIEQQLGDLSKALDSLK
ncbi:MAG: cell division protein ZapA [Flavobacteriia bacterium]|jgi:cell division protein ZapA|nr:cell division protein ZapA [Cryomorphaceae bacterium]